MAGFGFIKPKAISVDASQAPSLRDLPMQDKLLALSAILSGDTDALVKIPLLAQARRQQAEANAAETDLANFVSGKAPPPRPRAIPAFTPEADAGPDLGQSVTDQIGAGLGSGAIPRLTGNARVQPMADIRLPARSDVADAMGGPMNLRNALPLLMAASRKGVPLANIKEIRETIQGAEPQYDYVNNVRVDKRDPTAPAEIFEVDKGQRHVFDAEGRPIGVMNADGYVRSAAEAAGAVEGAKEEAKARFDVLNPGLPRRDGSSQPMTRLQAVGALAGGGGPGAPGVPRLGTSGVPQYRTQTPAEKTLAEERAKAQGEREASAPKAYSGLKAQAAATDLVLEHLDRILGLGKDGNPVEGKGMIKGGLGGSAGINALFAGVPETAAHNLQAALDPIKANIGFDKLAEMRANSPTGGALGQVSDTENRLLQSVYESIDQAQSPDQLQANLLRLRKELSAAREARRSAFGRQYNDASPTAGQRATKITPDQAREILARRRAARGEQ